MVWDHFFADGNRKPYLGSTKSLFTKLAATGAKILNKIKGVIQ